MKVFYDARWILVENRFDGVSRYSHELAWALHRQSDLELTWIIHDKRQLDKLPRGEYVLANDPNNGLAELRLPRLLNKAGAEIVYSPFFVMGTLGKKYKLILTIHDLIYFKHRTPPQWLPRHVRLGWRLFHLTYLPLRWQLNRADHIATVSQTAKRELLAANATRRQITTVCNAVNEDFTMKDSDHYKKNTIVYMGAFTPYKNVECLIDATALLPDITLHLCSKIPPARRPSLEAYIAEKDTTDRVILHNGVTDDVYRELLQNARCTISASRIEGFGLPLIEAGQAGVPFVAADIPIFREIGQDAVLYFNPDKPKQIAAHVQQLADKKFSQKIIKKGRENAARYTWDLSAQHAADIIRHDI